MNDFYVYIYLDTRKSGNFIYDDLEFEYEPIYVGKGKGDRYKRHFNFYNLYKSHFYSKLKNILEQGFEPIIIKKYENLTETESFEKERELIEIIGRKSKGGPLTNQSDGGEGQSGFIHSEESKNKISESLKNNKEFQEYMKSEEFRKKVSDGLKGHEGYGKGIPRSEEVKRKIKESCKNRKPVKHTQESKSKMSKNNRGKGNPNSKIYVVQIDGELKAFEGRKELIEYVNNYNISENLTGPNRVSVDGIIYKGKSKNFFLISVDKLKQRK